MTEPQAFAEIAENLSFLDDWEDRYRYVIELGQGLPPLAPGERNAETRVHGCASQVWLVTEAEAGADPVVRFRGESDAMIVRGLIAILIALYSGRHAADIAATDAVETFDRMGLREHLSTQRANGLVAMVERIRREAAALGGAG